MIRNYFKIALRSLMKNSVYSFINIGGLAIGIASSIILLWVANEYSFDTGPNATVKQYLKFAHAAVSSTRSCATMRCAYNKQACISSGSSQSYPFKIISLVSPAASIPKIMLNSQTFSSNDWLTAKNAGINGNAFY